MSEPKNVIFVLDDDHLVLDNIQRAVVESGHDIDWDVRAHKEGYGVEELLQEASPDVCVIDWDYKFSDSADASEVIRRIRQVAPTVPILRFTQFTMPDDAVAESSVERALGSNLKTLSKSDLSLHSPTPYAGLIRILEVVLASPMKQWT